ncbi:glycosyltransferase family 39 protein [Kiritimatiella glycovorans]|uniref:Putative membrane protein n=1 Tax=Kiritimatiella glycovorans TaxID=1307763 RepID=A0A0G3EF28_9BACT|nr:glycosyltransferase family 39 protein [Kiritimatiella glycovorans]AKJ65061.1 putative membrane protein [Kiritimatiella glycovorans]
MSRRVEIAGWILCLLLALLPRLWNLPARTFNLDEAYSFRFAERASLRQVFDPLSEVNRSEPHPTLFYTMTWGWLRSGYALLESSGATRETALRAMTVLVSLAGVAGVMAAARAWAGRRAGLAAGLLAALSVYSVLLAREARMYALLECGGAWLLFFLFRCLRDDRPRAGALTGLVLAGWFTMASHYLGIVYAACAWACLAAFRPRAWPRWGAAGLVLAGLYAYWLTGFLLQAAAKGGGSAWYPSTGLVIPFTFFAFAGGHGLVELAGRAEALRAAIPGLLLALFPLAALGVLWRRRGERAAAAPVVCAAVLLAAPLVLVWLASFRMEGLYDDTRYVAAGAPALFVPLAAGLTLARGRARPLIFAAAALFLAVNTAGLVRVARAEARAQPDWRAVAAELRAIDPDAVAVYCDYMTLPLGFYAPELELTGLPDRRIDARESLFEACPDLRQADSVVLMISHPRGHEDDYRRLFGEIYGGLEPAGRGFHRVELLVAGEAE